MWPHRATGVKDVLRSLTGLLKATEAHERGGRITKEIGRASLVFIDDFLLHHSFHTYCWSTVSKSFPFSLLIYLCQQGVINAYFVESILILNDYSCLCFIYPFYLLYRPSSFSSFSQRQVLSLSPLKISVTLHLLFFYFS